MLYIPLGGLHSNQIKSPHISHLLQKVLDRLLGKELLGANPSLLPGPKQMALKNRIDGMKSFKNCDFNVCIKPFNSRAPLPFVTQGVITAGIRALSLFAHADVHIRLC